LTIALHGLKAVATLKQARKQQTVRFWQSLWGRRGNTMKFFNWVFGSKCDACGRRSRTPKHLDQSSAAPRELCECCHDKVEIERKRKEEQRREEESARNRAAAVQGTLFVAEFSATPEDFRDNLGAIHHFLIELDRHCLVERFLHDATFRMEKCRPLFPEVIRLFRKGIAYRVSYTPNAPHKEEQGHEETYVDWCTGGSGSVMMSQYVIDVPEQPEQPEGLELVPLDSRELVAEATQSNSSYTFTHPALYSGVVWLHVEAKPENRRKAHRYTIRWGSWQFSGILKFEDHQSVNILHTKSNDGHSIPLFFDVAPPCFVEHGQGFPPAGPVHDINHGWTWIGE
jgi:hypothetical protein